MVDFDDDVLKKSSTLAELHAEDLSDASVSDLEDRILVLNAEIERVESCISQKKASQESAESFFKN